MADISFGHKTLKPFVIKNFVATKRAQVMALAHLVSGIHFSIDVVRRHESTSALKTY